MDVYVQHRGVGRLTFLKAIIIMVEVTVITAAPINENIANTMRALRTTQTKKNFKFEFYAQNVVQSFSSP